MSDLLDFQLRIAANCLSKRCSASARRITSLLLQLVPVPYLLPDNLHSLNSPLERRLADSKCLVPINLREFTGATRKLGALQFNYS